ncbi:HAD family hydrolase [Paenibacillus sp. LHD-117]|uniref:D-glycero-alpha-D-manno-heptose-1,7-bisphosphate 7-phosphatase n=1 Tax=Paenibacillus sp. LHD-117 TaxID=3071412 RepID=UPI0027E1B3A8|nr:HAD family hydrolase [Paenibacillus sp. LHD-117]MDQ6421695.1 HAD family hydrolase [Paenibacillus sp. LHD-117]
MKAFILDRDGVINKGGNINRKAEFVLLPGVTEAIKSLNDMGFEVFVASNQGGVGLGHMTKSALKSINGYMVTLIREGGGDIREARYCTHKPHAGCSCRKPKPGMLNALIEKYGIDRSQSFMVGDRDTDVTAGKNAHVRTVFLGKSIPSGARPDYHFDDLPSAVAGLLACNAISNEEGSR